MKDNFSCDENSDSDGFGTLEVLSTLEKNGSPASQNICKFTYDIRSVACNWMFSSRTIMNDRRNI